MNGLRHGNNVSIFALRQLSYSVLEIYKFMLPSKPFYIQIPTQKKRINVRLFELYLVQKFNSLFDKINFKDYEHGFSEQI